MKPINVALADDHIVMREGIADLISSFGNYTISIGASNGQELIEKIQAAQAPIDICLLDINMPVMDGHETLLKLKERWPEIKIIILSIFQDELTILRMMKNGANGYLAKNCDPKDLREALHNVYHTGVYHSPLISQQALQLIKTGAVKLPHITPREIEFLKLCCTECTYEQMARKMEVSPRTIDGYREHLFVKLKVISRVGLVIYALRMGLVVV